MASNNNGFTLVEVMIGMAIFVIGYLAVASMQMVAIKGDANGRKTTEAATLAADQLETLMVLPYDNIDIDPPDNAGSVVRGAYTVNWEFAAGPLDNTKTITITVVWQHGGQRTFEASYIKSGNM